MDVLKREVFLLLLSIFLHQSKSQNVSVIVCGLIIHWLALNQSLTLSEQNVEVVKCTNR